MWEGFRRSFLELWSAAVKQGTAGDLAPPQLFGAAAASGSEALQVAGHAVSMSCCKSPDMLGRAAP